MEQVHPGRSPIQHSTFVRAVLAPLIIAACDAPSEPTSRAATSPAELRAAAHGGPDVRIINVMDACEPESFGAIGVDCLRHGGLLFDKFISLLGKQGIMRAWHFVPSVVHAKVGQTLLAVNRGGEEHTFTEVEEFGGGIVPVLNALSGNPDIAPSARTFRMRTSSSPATSTTTTWWRRSASSTISAASTPGCARP